MYINLYFHNIVDPISVQFTNSNDKKKMMELLRSAMNNKTTISVGPGDDIVTLIDCAQIRFVSSDGA